MNDGSIFYIFYFVTLALFGVGIIVRLFVLIRNFKRIIEKMKNADETYTSDIKEKNKPPGSGDPPPTNPGSGNG